MPKRVFAHKGGSGNLVKASEIPFTIVRSTQFFEFAKGIVQSATEVQTVRLSPALFQPIAADDVAAALTGVDTDEKELTTPYEK